MRVLTVWLRLQTSDRCCVLAPALPGQQSATAMAVIYGWNVPRQLVVDNGVCSVPLMAEQMSRLTSGWHLMIKKIKLQHPEALRLESQLVTRWLIPK